MATFDAVLDVIRAVDGRIPVLLDGGVAVIFSRL
jgi:isopentenyl diphosphate isomerase/L-lactate dehydrogenase-like FMN-dependent dehydrogenase